MENIRFIFVHGLTICLTHFFFFVVMVFLQRKFGMMLMCDFFCKCYIFILSGIMVSIFNDVICLSVIRCDSFINPTRFSC